MDSDLNEDGIHWSPKMHRILSCIILTSLRRDLGLDRLESNSFTKVKGLETSKVRDFNADLLFD